MSKKNEVMNAPKETSVTKEEKLTFKRYIASIKRELGKVEKSSLVIAFSIHYLYNSGAYAIEGYKNICDLASDMFGFSKSTCYNFINVVERFGKPDVPELKDEYKGFCYSQLLCMVDCTDEQIATLTPDMSKRQLLAKIKAMNVLEDSNRLENEDRSIECEDGSEVVAPAKETKNILISCKGRDDYNAKLDEIDRLVLNVFNKSKKNVRIEIIAVEY